MTVIPRGLATTATVILALAVPAAAQDEPRSINAFAVVEADATIVRAAEKQLVMAGTIAGPFFVETSEGPVPAGRVKCAASARIDQVSRRHTASGACTFLADDGATAWGEWECAGYELVGCRGTFKLAGGTGRLAGAAGEAGLIWRPNAHELRKQLDGGTLDNATGILLWRDLAMKNR